VSPYFPREDGGDDDEADDVRRRPGDDEEEGRDPQGETLQGADTPAGHVAHHRRPQGGDADEEF